MILRDHLQAFVPIEIQALQKQGGPTDWHFEEAKKRLPRDESVSILIKGQTGKSIGQLVECLAVLAFVPGGITVFGCHFEAVADEET